MERYTHLARELSRSCPEMELLREEPMSRHTTFRIGGPVRLMAFPTTPEEMAVCLRTAQSLQARVEVMGNGSNLLVADEGLNALVINTAKLSAITRWGEHGVRAGAGVLLSRLAMWAAEHNLEGMEFAHGIPGSLGGAVTMNAGAYGGEMSQVVRQVEALDPQGESHTFQGEELDFSYRHSMFSGQDYVIVSACLELRPGDGMQVRARMNELAARRRASQPLELPSGGSMFKRPAQGYAAALIDQCGLKGFRVGDAQVSEKHAGFVVNRGEATCEDVLALVEQVRRTVLERTGVPLELEVRVLR